MEMMGNDLTYTLKPGEEQLLNFSEDTHRFLVCKLSGGMVKEVAVAGLEWYTKYVPEDADRLIAISKNGRDITYFDFDRNSLITFVYNSGKIPDGTYVFPADMVKLTNLIQEAFNKYLPVITTSYLETEVHIPTYVLRSLIKNGDKIIYVEDWVNFNFFRGTSLSRTPFKNNTIYYTELLPREFKIHIEKYKYCIELFNNNMKDTLPFTLEYSNNIRPDLATLRI